MGQHGPIPKRSDQRAGHTAKAAAPDRVARRAKVRRPAADKAWSKRARDWYLALGRSGQSAFYEPSDWEYARQIADQLTMLAKSTRPSAEMAKVLFSAMAELGTTEGSRRRMRIEVDRGAAPDDRVRSAKLAVVEQIAELG